QDKNEKYLKDNLSVFLDYKSSLNVDVYPFIWYEIHPSNKKYAGTFIAAERMKEYIEIIDKHNYNGASVSGALWWEPARSKRQANTANAKESRSGDYRDRIDVILSDVFGSKE